MRVTRSLIALVVLLTAIFFVVSSCIAEDSKPAAEKKQLNPSDPRDFRVEKYIKKIPKTERQEYVDVKAPAYPGLVVDLPSPQESLTKKPTERPGETVSEVTSDAMRISTQHGNGFYSPRGYHTGEIISVAPIKKD